MPAQATLPGPCCAIVLAAGQGRRFGGRKMLAPFRGAPMLSHPLRVLRQATEAGWLTRVLVVIPVDTPDLLTLVTEHHAEPVIQWDPDASQGDSLRLGLEAAAGAGSALVVLGDQPLLSLGTITAVLEASNANPGAIIRPRYALEPEIPGHPVLLPAGSWEAVAAAGGVRAVATRDAPVVLVPVPGSNPDVDTAANLRSIASLPE